MSSAICSTVYLIINQTRESGNVAIQSTPSLPRPDDKSGTDEELDI